MTDQKPTGVFVRLPLSDGGRHPLELEDFLGAAKRFMGKVSVKELDECWPWMGSVLKKGNRGTFSIKNRTVTAPKVSWIISNKSLPRQGLFACHTCDNPNCVNPNHIWMGTNQENIQDASKKKRLSGMNVTHCPRGHEYNETNTRWIGSHRSCKKCSYFLNKEYYKNNPEANEKRRERVRRYRAKIKALKSGAE